MKTLLLLTLCAMICAGCKSPEATAYKTIATIATTVDTAMNAWGDYVRKGLARDMDQNIVREFYVQYQASMRTAESAVIAAKTAPPGSTSYQIAIRALSESADNLIFNIEVATGKELKK